MKEGIQSIINNEEIKEFGCYFLDILRWAEIETNRDFIEAEIILMFNEAKKRGFLGKDCFVEDAVRIYELAAGSDPYCLMSKTCHKPDKEIYIVCQKKPMYTHFVLSHNGKIWDSLDPARRGAAGYMPDSYRVFV